MASFFFLLFAKLASFLPAVKRSFRPGCTQGRLLGSRPFLRPLEWQLSKLYCDLKSYTLKTLATTPTFPKKKEDDWATLNKGSPWPSAVTVQTVYKKTLSNTNDGCCYIVGVKTGPDWTAPLFRLFTSGAYLFFFKKK